MTTQQRTSRAETERRACASAPWAAALALAFAAGAACRDAESGSPVGLAGLAGVSGSAGSGAGGLDGSDSGASGAQASAGASGAAGAAEAPGADDESAGVAWDDPPGSVAAGDWLGQRVLSLLRARCASCHLGAVDWGSFEAPEGATPSAMESDVELSELLEKGWLIPGSGATSPAFQALATRHDGDPRVLSATPGELELVERFIDGLAVDAPPCEPLPFVSPDDAFAAMAADVAALSADVRQFTRYLGLTYASNAGSCGAALERQRRALFELVNALSTGPSIVLPRAVDVDALIYRVDMRDYGWNRAVASGGGSPPEVADGWQALVAAAGPYALRYQGVDADIVSQETTAPVPFLPANAAIYAGLSGDVYYALLGIPADMAEQRLALGLAQHPITGEAADPAAGVRWAAFTGNLPAREVFVVRASASTRPYWMMQDLASIDAESIFDQPFEYDQDAPYQSLFALPNGLTAYAAERSDGLRAPDVAAHCIDCDAMPVGAASCGACHGAGPLAVRDQVRAFVLENQQQYDTDTFAAVQTAYAPVSELEASIAADRVIARAAIEQLGISPRQADPLSRVYHQFELDAITRRRAAAELGVSVGALEAAQGGLPAALAPLREGGSIDRASFSAAFAEAACVLHAAPRQRPASCP